MIEKNILVCGDPHGSFEHIVMAALEHRPVAVLLLGDNTPSIPLEQELAPILGLTNIYWIHGNHDTDSERYFDNQFASALGQNNIHGCVIDIAGVRVAGLGGIFRSKIWDDTGQQNESAESYLKACGKGNRWRGGLPLRHRSSIFRADVAALARQRADILITHEAPDLYVHGSPVLTQLAADMRVKYAFHGHHHVDKRYDGSVWIGVGLRGIVTLDGNVIRPGDVDNLGIA